MNLSRNAFSRQALSFGVNLVLNQTTRMRSKEYLPYGPKHARCAQQ